MPSEEALSGVERRQNTRVPYSGNVTILWGGRRIAARGNDLSARGISFYVNTQDFGRGPVLNRWALGRVVRMFFELESAQGRAPVNVPGQIVRVIENGGKNLVGVALGKTGSA